MGVEQAKGVFDTISGLPWPLNWIAWTILVLGTVGVLAWRSIVFVHTGEVAVILRQCRVVKDKSGKVKYKEPGFNFKYPFYDKAVKISTLEHVFVLREGRADYPNAFVSLDVEATVIVTVEEPYKLVYIVNQLDDAVRGVCESELWMCILEGAPSGCITRESRDRIAVLYAECVNAPLADWGLKLKLLAITRSARQVEGIKGASIASLGQSAAAELAQKVLAPATLDTPVLEPEEPISTVASGTLEVVK